MPAIPVIQQQTRASMAGLGPGPSGGQGIEALAAGLEDVENANFQAQVAEIQLQERNAAAEANAEVMAARAHWIAQLQERQNNAAPGAAGFTPQVLADFDKDTAERVKKAKTAGSRKHLEQRLADVRMSVYQDALQFETVTGAKHREGLLQQSHDNARIAAEFRPEDFDKLLEEQEVGINASGVAQQRAEELRGLTKAGLAEAAVMGMMRRNPRSTLKELNNEQSKISSINALGFEDRERLRNAAESEVRRLDAEARARAAEARDTLRTDEADALAAKAAGLPAQLPPKAAYIAAYGAEGAARHARSSQMFQVYDVAGAAVGMPPDQAAEALQRFAPKQQQGAAEQSEMYRAALQIYQQQRKAFEADPAGGVLSRDPEAAKLFQAAEAAGADQAAIDAYVRRVTSVQQGAGIQAPAILPESAAEAIGQQLQPNPAAPGNRAKQLTMLEQKWGAHYGAVLKQVAPKLDGIGQILPFVPQRTAERLDEAAANPKPIMEAVQLTGMKSDLEKAVSDQMEELDGSLPSGVITEAAEKSAQFRDAVLLYAADLMRGGTSPRKAAAQAYQEIVDSQYVIQGRLRVPRRDDGGRGRQINTDMVFAGADAAKRQLTSGQRMTWDGYPAVKNSDGSFSTRLTMTVTDPGINGGQPTNIPSIWRGKVLNEADAVREAQRSGITFPVFPSVDVAVSEAKRTSSALDGGEFLMTPSQWETAADAQADIRDIVRREGYWVANKDETGVFLAYPMGIVYGADGQPIQRTWQQLEEAAAAKRRADEETAQINAQAVDRNIR